MTSESANRDITRAWAYHNATKHSEWSVRSTAHYLDWSNQPLPFKIYTTLQPIQLPRDADQTGISALSAISAAGIPGGAEQRFGGLRRHGSKTAVIAGRDLLPPQMFETPESSWIDGAHAELSFQSSENGGDRAECAGIAQCHHR